MTAEGRRGSSDEFMVTAKLGQDTTGIFLIAVLVSGGSGISFNSGCTSTNSLTRVPAGVTSHTATLTLHACAEPGGTITARLIHGTAIATDSQSVTVVDPPVVEFDNPPSILYVGEQATLSVEAEDIPTTGSYEIKATAYGAEDGESSSRDSDIGFNSTCSDVEESEDVTTGATTHTATFTLHACDFENNGGGVVTVVLLDGNDNVITGDWFYVEVKPITVTITADNPFPVTTGTTKEREVELTATVDGPDGATFTYQWQEWSGSSWADISGATSSAYEIDSTVSTTKSLRVKAVSDGETYTSPEVAVTWGLGKTLREITDALAANMPVLQEGTTQTKQPLIAQADLLKCVKDAPPAQGGGTWHGSFAALMTQYTGATKTLLNSGNCSGKANTAWSALTTAFTTTFTGLERDAQNNLTPVGQFLLSEPGQSLKKYLLSQTSLTDSIQNFIVPAAAILAAEPVERQGSQGGGGIGGQQGEGDEGQESGLGCIPAQGTPDASNSASLTTRLNVLNCLLFATPWQFWLDLAAEDPDINGNTPSTDYELAIDRLSWLGYGDLKCTIGPQVREGWWEEIWGWSLATAGRLVADFGDSHWEKAACLKHDLAFESLRRFAGPTKPTESKFERDEAWNPRNKVLADFLFYIDLQCESVESLPNTFRGTCLARSENFTKFLNWGFFGDSSWRRAFAVSRLNTVGWPVTREMLADASTWRSYKECQTHEPSLTALSFSRQGKSVAASYTVEDCVNSAYEIEICFKAPDEFCKEAVNGETFLAFVVEDFIPETLYITKVILKPTNKIYGPDETESVVEKDYRIRGG